MTTIVRPSTQTIVAPSGVTGTQGVPGPAGSGTTIGVKDEGTLVSGVVERINISGAGAFVSGSGADVTINIPSGAGLTPQDFGAVADGVTDDSAAFLAALAALKAGAISGYGYTIGGGSLFVPKGVYYLGSTTLDIDFAVVIEGETGTDATGGGSVLKWATNTTGIRLQKSNTSGATAATGSGTGADGTIICGLNLAGPRSGAEGEYHGIHARCRFKAEDVFIDGFQGDGVHIKATAGGGVGSEGNANGWCLNKVMAQVCRNGIYLDGADVNAGIGIGCNVGSNRQAGIYDSAFLSNSWIGCHADANGIQPTSTTMCSYSGNRYVVKLGQEVGASTNAPSGTTADNTWWKYHSAGAAAPGALAWTSGLTWRVGGGYICDSGGGNAFTVFVGCYAETGQPVNQIYAPAAMYGGNMQAGNYGSGGQPLTYNAYQGDMAAVYDVSSEAAYATLRVRKPDGSIHYEWGVQFGLRTYDVAIGNREFWTGTSYGTIALRVTINSTGLNLEAGHVYKIAGTQVVGAQRTGWTAATGTASRGAFAAAAAGTASGTYVQAELQGALNRIAALEARLIALEADNRAHGLIN